LDDKLAIKRFTTQAKKVFSLIDSDVGRPISDLAANLRYDELVEDAQDVLRSLVFREKEIQTKEGSWRQMRVMPYRTHENVIDGLVITFVDVDRVKRAEQESQEARAFAEGIVESVRGALLVLDPSLRVISANPAFCELFHTTAKLVVGEAVQNLADGQWNDAKLTKFLKQVLADGDGMAGLRLEVSLPRGGRKVLDLAARALHVAPKKPARILLSVADVTGPPESVQHDGRAGA